MEKISDLFGGQNSITKVMKVLLQGSVDNIPPIGDVIPWLSDSDIPEGYDHLGAQTPEEAKQGTRFYSSSEYPEFRAFMSRTGNSYMAKGSLPILSTGEVLRQVVKQGSSDPSYDKDFTAPWDWQVDAIRPVIGTIGAEESANNAWLYIHEKACTGVFSRTSITANTFKYATNTSDTYWGAGWGSAANFDISRSHPVAKDVRMANRSVNWLIKVKHTKGQQDMIDALNAL